MSENETVRYGVVVPEGMEAYVDGNLIRLRPIEPKPETLLSITHEIRNHDGSLLAVDRFYDGYWSETEVRSEAASDLVARNPAYRNLREFVDVTARISHPDIEWVQQAAAFLVDYLGTHLAEVTAEHLG